MANMTRTCFDNVSTSWNPSGRKPKNQERLAEWLRQIMRRSLVCLCLGCFMEARAAALTIARDGHSDYRIVTPARTGQAMDSYVREAAVMLRDCLKQTTGADLPIVVEQAGLPDAPSLYIGACQAAGKAGIELEEFRGWEYLLKSDGVNLYLLGRDASGSRIQRGGYRGYYLPTVKAVAEFLERFVGVRFVLPAAAGVATESRMEIIVPAELSHRRVPIFSFCIGLSRDMFYDLANNHLPGVEYGSYGGHSHDVAIPAEKYGEAHPEYFRQTRDGQREIKSVRPQYCLSNPAVRELIYKEILRKLDEGFQVAQLGQSDGFRPCECADCQALYGVEDMGEKLWIMHRDMAERLLKDRPGCRVAIMAYGPSRNPPKTFLQFPDNVVVELTTQTESFFQTWQTVDVPGGFYVYVYNWGSYHREGFTPKRTPQFCKDQVCRLQHYGVHGIYKCGFGELYGLEGPVYYVYGKLLADPELDPDALTADYCRAGFGSAAPAMERFFGLLHARLALHSGTLTEDDWSAHELLDGTGPQEALNIATLALRYPSETLDELTEYFAEARRVAGSDDIRKRLDVVEVEFDYLKVTARIAGLFTEYGRNPTAERFVELAAAIDARNAFIAALPYNKQGTLLTVHGVPMFGRKERAFVQEGGRLKAPLRTPYTWNTAAYRKYGVIPGAAVIQAPRASGAITVDGRADEPAWAAASERFLIPVNMAGGVEPGTAVRTVWDGTALYALFRCRGIEPSGGITTRIRVYFGPEASETNLFMFSAKLGAQYKSVARYPWIPSYATGVEFEPLSDDSPCTVATSFDEAAGEAVTEMRIPFAVFRRQPSPGDVWRVNFVRDIGGQRRFIWEPNIYSQAGGRDMFDVMGKVEFVGSDQ